MSVPNTTKFIYSVQRGDTYQLISEMFYGTNQYAGYLSLQTGGALPEGEKISVPPIWIAGKLLIRETDADIAFRVSFNPTYQAITGESEYTQPWFWNPGGL